MGALGSAGSPLLVAVVGSGPSGFYAVEALLKSGLEVRVNLIEKLPAPFGLVRYGVAPDHPKLKQVSLVFHKIAQHPHVQFYGNVELGQDVSLSDLQETHHAVVLCYGAERDRRLGIAGEDLPGSHTATEFVAWYNGHPAYRDSSFDLSSRAAVIVGHGNVAADVCRILAKPVEALRQTDIAKHALEALAESRVREIHLVGRRGPAQAKFTSKELRELGELPDCVATVEGDSLRLGPEDETELAEKTNDNAAKCYQIFKQLGRSGDGSARRRIHFHFLLSPLSLNGKGRLESLTFTRNSLVGSAFEQHAEATKETIDIACGLCFRSIGYRGEPLPDVPFEERRGVVPNEAGRVRQGLYVSGWIKRGPSGIIGTNRADSVETIATLLGDVQHLGKDGASSKASFAGLVSAKRLHPISYDQWRLIDSAETQQGEKSGKPREKITSVDQMLAIAG